MPLAKLKTPPFKPPRDAIVTWNTWRKGLNTLLRENEVDAAEMTQSTNIVLIGSGVPTKRWGSQDFYLSAPTGYGRFLGAYKDSSENREVLSMTSWGYLVKKSGASYAMIGGASWPSAFLSFLSGTTYKKLPNHASHDPAVEEHDPCDPDLPALRGDQLPRAVGFL